MEKLLQKKKNISNKRIASVKDILDYASTKYLSKRNASPYYGMKEIYKETFKKLIDVCLIDYPEPLSRLYLGKYAELDYYKCKEIFESIMIAGEQLSKASKIMGFG